MAKHLGNYRKQQRVLIWIGIPKVIVEDVNQDIPGGKWWRKKPYNIGKHNQELLTGNCVHWRCFVEFLGRGRDEEEKDDDDDDNIDNNHGDDDAQVC